MKTINITSDNIEKIRQLFPNCVSEVEDNGILVKKIDFDILRAELGDESLVEGLEERYRLDRPGKKRSILKANTPITKTLRPLKNDSLDRDTTGNIYIQGDNFEVLKILQESYLGKIKCIYIDPPYNTGNDFVYNDNFTENSEEYKGKTEQNDEGYKMVKNTETNGRFHSDWLSMMYERLKVARDLLTDDGAIFMSIDDNELYNLKKIADEVFGEDNLINCISIKMSELSGVKMKHLTKYPKLKESLLIYGKDTTRTKMVIEKHIKEGDNLESYLKYYSNIIENIEDNPEKRKIIPIKDYLKKNNIDEKSIDINQWKIDNAKRIVYRTNSKTVTKYVNDNPSAPSICKIINNDGNEVIKRDDKEMLFLEKYIEEYLGDIWMDISTINLNKETDINVFENGQKPLKLLERVIKSLSMNEDEPFIVLDFFSGSATTAHACMKLNAEDGLNRKYIMVQLPEMCNPESKASKEGYNNICEIGKERIRRAGNKIKEETGADIDYGFRVYKVDESCMKDVYYHPEDTKQSNLGLFASNIKEDRTAEDLLTQVILNLGLTLDLPIEEKRIKNNKVFYVAGNSLIACFDENIDFSIIEEIAKEQPLKMVLRDSSFKSDADRINFENTFKEISRDTTIKVI